MFQKRNNKNAQAPATILPLPNPLDYIYSCVLYPCDSELLHYSIRYESNILIVLLSFISFEISYFLVSLFKITL